MSRSASPASADSRPDTDEVSNFVHVTECECARQHLRATQLRIFRHKMWDTSVMAWATHNALRVVWYCQRCNQRYPETFEFSSSGKSRRFGAYQYHQGKKERLEVNIHWDDVRYEYLKIRGDAADYSLILFNCKAWATLFCKNISKRTRINTNECACDTLGQNCQRNATTWKRKYAVRRYEQEFRSLDNIDMGRIWTVYEGMDGGGRYHLIYYNSFHWTRDFYRKVMAL
ncbi:hypothetical protein niasHS_013199 [Heterodera schachtii]|uniref:Uncharacterized protein n=1 Tax=Heterodera schachtii TaxID=97005 RepID=A0ABD2IH75_HETSC